MKMWRQASLPAVEGGILPHGKTARRVKHLDLTVVFPVVTQFRRAGSHGSTSAMMADATIFRHALIPSTNRRLDSLTGSGNYYYSLTLQITFEEKRFFQKYQKFFGIIQSTEAGGRDSALRCPHRRAQRQAMEKSLQSKAALNGFITSIGGHLKAMVQTDRLPYALFQPRRYYRLLPPRISQSSLNRFSVSPAFAREPGDNGRDA
jgi:hypothetical protein